MNGVKFMKILTVILCFLITNIAFAQSSTNTSTTTSTGSTGTTTQVEPVEPEITEEEAQQQALDDTAPPQQVFDLTNSGVVYGILQEGVAAWIAQMDGNIDEWGNERSSVYVSATRPDVVPASLQTFLLAYYKDNPTIGLAYGPDGIIEAEGQLEDHFNETVKNRGDKLYQDAVDKAEEETKKKQEEADNAEDVPPLDDDEDNGEDDEEEEEPSATISSISPSDFDISGSTQTIDITGKAFGTETTGITVSFSNGFEGIKPDSVSDSLVTITVPSDFIAGEKIGVTITKNGETTDPVTITARATLDSVSPTEIKNGDTLTVKGYGFDHTTASNNVVLFAINSETIFELTADSANFLSADKCAQLTLSVDSSEITTVDHTITVITNNLAANGSDTVTFTE